MKQKFTYTGLRYESKPINPKLIGVLSLAYDPSTKPDLSILKFIQFVDDYRQSNNMDEGDYALQHELATEEVLEQHKVQEKQFKTAMLLSLSIVLIPFVWLIYLFNKSQANEIVVNADNYINRKKSHNKSYALADRLDNKSSIREDQSKGAKENFGLRFRKVISPSEDGKTLTLFFTNDKQRKHYLAKLKQYDKGVEKKERVLK